MEAEEEAGVEDRSILSDRDESLIEGLVTLLREDQALLEEVESQGVVQTILRMNKQSNLEGWRKQKQEGVDTNLTVISGDISDRGTNQANETEAGEEDMTTVMDVRSGQVERSVHVGKEDVEVVSHEE